MSVERPGRMPETRGPTPIGRDRRGASDHAAGDTVRFATFRLSGHLMGIDVARVQEVMQAQPTTQVPLAHPVVAGLINLRGVIVVSFDLRRRIGFAPRRAGAEAMNVFVRTREGLVSLVVDEVSDVIDVPREAFEPVPDTLDPHLASVALGVYKLKECLLLELNLPALCELPSPPESPRGPASEYPSLGVVS